WKPRPDRRGAHAGLLALLARRRLRPRQLAAELRQAVRPRPPARDQLEPGPTRAEPAGGCDPAHPGKIPDCDRTADGRAVKVRRGGGGTTHGYGWPLIQRR